jgi:hypothetical protein
MNDILEKLKANWMLIAGVIAAYMLLGGKKGGTRSRMRRRARRTARRSYGRMRRMRRR